MAEIKKITGYPSIDKPWMKYYSEEAVNARMPSQSAYTYVLENNREHLDDIALVYFGRRITYGELFQNIERAAIAFQAIGVSAGDVVSLISITTPELVYCVYALNKIGAVANMLDPRASEKTLISQISSTQSKTLVVLDQCTDKLDALEKQLQLEHIIVIPVSKSMGFPVKQAFLLKTGLGKKNHGIATCSHTEWDAFLQESSAGLSPATNDSADAPAFIWYTGGTTGEPKGVLLSNSNINAVAEQYRLAVKGLPRQQTWLTVSAPFIAYSLICGLHLPLGFGMTCYIELYDPEAIAKTVVRKKYNHVLVTPVVWENIIRNPHFEKKDFGFLIAPTSGADYMSPNLENSLNAFFESHHCTWKICQGYGMTEVGSGVAWCSSDSCYKPGSVGIPFSHTIISAFEPENGMELPTGENGEICICGPSVMIEYFNHPEATHQVLRVHKDGKKWMHTGDIGRIDEDGNLFITGRMKRMITRFDGFKVFPSAVEEKILTHSAVEKCCVVGRKDTRSDSGQLPVAFLVLKTRAHEQNSEIVEEIKAHCEKNLPEYARPVQFFIRETFPLTAAGKIDYRALEKEAADQTK